MPRPTTWDELVDAGTKVTDLDAQKYGFYMRGDSYWAQPFTWAWGGSLYKVAEDGNVTVIHQQPRVRRGLELPEGQHPRDRRLRPLPGTYTNDYGNMTTGLQGRHRSCAS